MVRARRTLCVRHQQFDEVRHTVHGEVEAHRHSSRAVAGLHHDLGSDGLLQQRWPSATSVFAIGERPLLKAIEEAGYRLTAAEPEIVVLG
jgi:hypothetical protein